jgi:hypothetical protein
VGAGNGLDDGLQVIGTAGTEGYAGCVGVVGVVVVDLLVLTPHPARIVVKPSKTPN